MDLWMDGYLIRWMDIQMYGLMDRREGWIDGSLIRCTDRRMDR